MTDSTQPIDLKNLQCDSAARDWLANLPAWDGVHRLQALLDDFHGSKDAVIEAEVLGPPLGPLPGGLAICFMRRPFQAGIAPVVFDPERLSAA